MEDLPYEIQLIIIQEACNNDSSYNRFYTLTSVMLLNKYWNGVAHDAMEQEPLKSKIKKHINDRQWNMLHANYVFFKTEGDKPEMPAVKHINKRKDIPHTPRRFGCGYTGCVQDVEDETFKEKLIQKGYCLKKKYKTPKEFKAFTECSVFSGIRNHLTPRFFYGDYRRKDRW
jgi:hypothetical protein